MITIETTESVLTPAGTPGAYDLALLRRFGGATVYVRRWFRRGELIRTVTAGSPIEAAWPTLAEPPIPSRDTVAVDVLIDGPLTVVHRLLLPRLSNSLGSCTPFFGVLAIFRAIEGHQTYWGDWPTTTAHGGDAAAAATFLRSWTATPAPHEARRWADGMLAVCRQIATWTEEGS